MKNLKIFKPQDIEKLISKRLGETKFGENIGFINQLSDLEKAKAAYVLLGVPEDIGVRANHGTKGTSKAWNVALRSLLNIQKNRFNDPENIILLGTLDCTEWMQKTSNIDNSDPNYLNKLGDIVKEIDLELSDIIETIVSYGKIPIVIGGGHNNAYGNIKGTSKGLKEPVNVMNIDAHTDLRQLEHRHSGNGFSYAIEGQFLCEYSVFGLQKNYTPEYIFEEMHRSENLNYTFIEELLDDPSQVDHKFSDALEQIGSRSFGLELDCDAIAYFSSSAISPSGFSVDQIRKFLRLAGKHKNCKYLHICEAAPTEVDSAVIGKAISYFITDFVRS